MLASFFWGMSGSVTSVITGVTAYLAAVTGPEERIGRLLVRDVSKSGFKDPDPITL